MMGLIYAAVSIDLIIWVLARIKARPGCEATDE